MSDDLPPDCDDGLIPDDELLYIRVYPDPDAIYFDPDTGEYRAGTTAFRDNTGPLSADRSSLSTAEQTRDWEPSHPYHVVAIKAGTARKYDCRVVPDPRPQTATHAENKAHVSIFGDHKLGNGALRNNSQARRIAHDPDTKVVLINDKAPRSS